MADSGERDRRVFDGSFACQVNVWWWVIIFYGTKGTIKSWKFRKAHQLVSMSFGDFTHNNLRSFVYCKSPGDRFSLAAAEACTIALWGHRFSRGAFSYSYDHTSYFLTFVQRRNFALFFSKENKTDFQMYTVKSRVLTRLF